MNRKAKYGIQIIYNLIRMPFRRICSGGKIRASSGQLLSCRTRLICEQKGTIILNGCNQTEDGVLLHSIGGKIICNGVYLNRNCSVVSMEAILIGNNVTVGPNVCIYDHDHNTAMSHERDRDFVSSPIVINDNVWIGANATILKGVSIGKNAIVAAGATVIRDVPERAIVGGVPARVIKTRE